ncbi:hypothetical protein GCM10022251_41670 [Phytohabitans flavus]|uniref:Uncharacterized protein n=1 Tax=Phytohabitans flavus TaxID=1076124 RepID=A0A6F8Y0M3_9ACTN|nr:hypothetical protein [Phytohabitans flavus]BCB79589.1 hypothetical protein Pflav_059990 [Phytohabitans flavus]
MRNLRAIIESLDEDLSAWRDGAAQPPLDKHASQIEGVVEQVSTALAALRPALDDAGSASLVTQSVLDYHHIWDFFRGKLALRYVPMYQPLLAAADDLAWAAWRPVRDAFRAHTGTELREPPLVYFSRSAVPFAVPRGDDYRDLLPRGGIYTEEAGKVASALVVPVVSLPWHRTNWLPVTLSVAHEVGHVVVADLGLDPWLTDRLAAAGLAEDRADAWLAWREEVYADIFAAVVCGGATALSLLGQLRAEDAEQPPQAPWGTYPPASLRERIIREVANRRGDAPPSAPAVSAGDFATDVPAVVTALLDESLPGAGRLGDLFSTVDTVETRDDADRLARGRDMGASEIRALLAAATRAFEAAPDDVDRLVMQRAALTAAAHAREVGRRSRPRQLADRLADRDRKAGQQLASLLAPVPTPHRTLSRGPVRRSA